MVYRYKMIPVEASIIHGDISCGSITVGPWGVHDNGHIIPSSNATFDIGNVDYKVRHLYLSDNIISNDVTASGLIQGNSIHATTVTATGALNLGGTINLNGTTGNAGDVLTRMVQVIQYGVPHRLHQVMHL